jgi:hypothetical protein
MAHAAQTMKNLGGAAKQTLAGRIMGDYNASHGSFGGAMARQMRAERLSMAQDDQSHAGGSGSPGGSSGPGGMSGSIGPGSGNAGGGATPGGVAQTGGFDNLSPDDQAKASAAHTEGQESNPEQRMEAEQGQAYQSPAAQK